MEFKLITLCCSCAFYIEVEGLIIFVKIVTTINHQPTTIARWVRVGSILKHQSRTNSGFTSLTHFVALEYIIFMALRLKLSFMLTFINTNSTKRFYQKCPKLCSHTDPFYFVFQFPSDVSKWLKEKCLQIVQTHSMSIKRTATKPTARHRIVITLNIIKETTAHTNINEGWKMEKRHIFQSELNSVKRSEKKKTKTRNQRRRGSPWWTNMELAKSGNRRTYL